MRKLTPDEEHALAVLTKHVRGLVIDESYLETAEWRSTKAVLDELVRKKRAWVEPTDGGPRYHAQS